MCDWLPFVTPHAVRDLRKVWAKLSGEPSSIQCMGSNAATAAGNVGRLSQTRMYEMPAEFNTEALQEVECLKRQTWLCARSGAYRPHRCATPLFDNLARHPKSAQKFTQTSRSQAKISRPSSADSSPTKRDQIRSAPTAPDRLTDSPAAPSKALSSDVRATSVRR